MSLGSMLLYFSHAIFTVQSQVGPQVRYTLAVPANQRPSPSPVIFVSQGHLLQPTLKALRQYNPPTSPLLAPNVSSYLPVTLYDGPSGKLLVLRVIRRVFGRALTSLLTSPDEASGRFLILSTDEPSGEVPLTDEPSWWAMWHLGKSSTSGHLWVGSRLPK